MEGANLSMKEHRNSILPDISTGFELYTSLLRTAQWLSQNQSKMSSDIVDVLTGESSVTKESTTEEQTPLNHQPLCFQKQSFHIQNDKNDFEMKKTKEADSRLTIEADRLINGRDVALEEQRMQRIFRSEELDSKAKLQEKLTIDKHSYRSKTLETADDFCNLSTAQSFSNNNSPAKEAIEENFRCEKKSTSRDMTTLLKTWLYEHRKNPYPTKEEKLMLSLVTRMNLTQVSTWFANARRRLKKDNQMTWHARNRMISEHDSWKGDSVFGTISGCTNEETLKISKEMIFSQSLANAKYISSCSAFSNNCSRNAVNPPVPQTIFSKFSDLCMPAERHFQANSVQISSEVQDDSQNCYAPSSALIPGQTRKEYLDFFFQWMNYYLLTYLNSNIENACSDRLLDMSIPSTTAGCLKDLPPTKPLHTNHFSPLCEQEAFMTQAAQNERSANTEVSIIQSNNAKVTTDKSSEGINSYSHIKDDFRKIEALLLPISISTPLE